MGGKLTVAEGYAARLVVLTEKAGVGGSPMRLHIYGGVLAGNGQVYGDNGGVVCGMSRESVIYLYAGTVSNGVVSKQGGNIYTNGSLNICGGTVTGGKAAGYGSGIALGLGGKIQLSGKPVIEKNLHSSGTYENNLFVMEKTALSFGTMKSGAKIGISAPLGVFAEKVSKDVTAYLFSDVAGTTISYKQKTLILKKAD